MTNVQAAIDQTCANVNTVLSSLTPTKYIKPTPVDGVTISSGGYAKVGNLVIVNMSIFVNTSKLTISTDSNYANTTIVATGMPEPQSGTRGYLIFSYHSTAFKGVIGYTTPVYNDTLRVFQHSEYTYPSGYGMSIHGTYLAA